MGEKNSIFAHYTIRKFMKMKSFLKSLKKWVFCEEAFSLGNFFWYQHSLEQIALPCKNLDNERSKKLTKSNSHSGLSGSFHNRQLGGSFIFGIQQRIVAGLFFEAGNLKLRDFAVAGVAFDSAIYAGIGFQLSFGPGRQETDRSNRPILLSKRILSFLAGRFQWRVLET